VRGTVDQIYIYRRWYGWKIGIGHPAGEILDVAGVLVQEKTKMALASVIFVAVLELFRNILIPGAAAAVEVRAKNRILKAQAAPSTGAVAVQGGLNQIRHGCRFTRYRGPFIMPDIQVES
jgi:hypothetical protein